LSFRPTGFRGLRAAISRAVGGEDVSAGTFENWSGTAKFLTRLAVPAASAGGFMELEIEAFHAGPEERRQATEKIEVEEIAMGKP